VIDYPLMQQQQSPEYMELLFTLTRFKGDMKHAINAHFLQGWAVTNAAQVHDVKLSNLTTAIKRLNEVNDTVQKLHRVK
jgi:hypothetical protein